MIQIILMPLLILKNPRGEGLDFILLIWLFDPLHYFNAKPFFNFGERLFQLIKI